MGMLPEFPRVLFDIPGLTGLETVLRETEPDVTACPQWGRDGCTSSMFYRPG